MLQCCAFCEFTFLINCLYFIAYRFYDYVSFPNFNNKNILLYIYYLALNAVILEKINTPNLYERKKVY